jgi:hypothetical protein
MNVLHIVDDPEFGRVLATEGVFSGLPYATRLKEIEVTDPENPYGDPIYMGPAAAAAKVLEPGPYWYVFVEDHYPDLFSD